jgi:hypothetical protein
MLRRTRLAVLVAPLVAALVGLHPAPATADGDPSGPVTPVVAAKANPVTPGAFTGYGFDQCVAPEQYKMDAWLAASPFRAVGVYSSGASRACRDQPNLTSTWVATQLAKGWKILPITLGPQAFCNPRFPRYGEPVIARNATGNYAKALEHHYEAPQEDYHLRFISSYASAHPWEDFAETFAHYLHMRDTLETAEHFGFTRGKPRATGREASVLCTLLDDWQGLTVALNALNRSMGLPDAYPFALTPLVEVKLAFVHELVSGQAAVRAVA